MNNIFDLFVSSIRSAFDVIFKKSATLQDVTPVDGDRDSIGLVANGVDAISSPNISKKVQLVSVLKDLTTNA